MARRGYADVLEKDPTKSVSREEQIGRNTKKLQAGERQSLKNQIAQIEDEILAKKDLNPNADIADLKKRLEDVKNIVNHDEELGPKSDSQRDRLSARSREIESILKKEMPTKIEMEAKTGTNESARAIRHNLKFQEMYQDAPDSLVREWQDIQLKLNPDDPMAQSLENIRPER